jgi:hypothetical protein
LDSHRPRQARSGPKRRGCGTGGQELACSTERDEPRRSKSTRKKTTSLGDASSGESEPRTSATNALNEDHAASLAALMGSHRTRVGFQLGQAGHDERTVVQRGWGVALGSSSGGSLDRTHRSGRGRSVPVGALARKATAGASRHDGA